ncbi:hypothetical protein HN51_047439 [Arachis hypogaea]
MIHGFFKIKDVLYCTHIFQRVFEPRKLEFLGLTDSEQNVMNGNVFIHEKWQLKPKNFAFLGGGPKVACAGCAGFAAFSVVIEKFLDRHE